MAHPHGTKVNSWRLQSENQKGNIKRFVIKRWVRFPDGSATLERLPTKHYALIRNNEEELKKLVIRLNERTVEERAKKAFEIKHAFISTEFLDNYREHLLIQIPSKRQALYEYFCLTRYFLNFFINKLQMNDPIQWHLHHKSKWATFLLSKEAPKSAHAKRIIISAANRFMLYLHEQRPTESPPLKFTPFTKAKFKDIEAKRQFEGETRLRQFIKVDDWSLIEKELPDSIRTFANLAYHYGLRRSETLGLKTTDVRKGYVSAERQLRTISEKIVYAPLKGKEFRKVPHWLSTPEQAAKWIAEGQTKLIHPDTLSDRWKELMKNLTRKDGSTLDYDFHDLRHTWITRVIRDHKPRDVQLSAGHKSIQTTMGYLHEDREMDDEVFELDKVA